MRYVSLQNLPPDAFKRLVGIPPDLFAEQLMVLEQAERAKRKPGRPGPLSLADQLLLTLGYWCVPHAVWPTECTNRPRSAS